MNFTLHIQRNSTQIDHHEKKVTPCTYKSDRNAGNGSELP